MPGVLPTINRQAVEYTIMTALALNCTINANTKFDRKNYPYPDLVKGYQISQYDMPFSKNGWLEIEVDGKRKRIGITRVHLEEDVGKLLHRNDGESYSLIDFNRSGVPLMEIVSEPDMRSPEEARQYLMKLRSILRYLGVSDANMEEGSFRCDANISIRPVGSTELFAKVEVKNMNSFRAVYRALEFEAHRQRDVAAKNGRLPQETRGWVEEKGITVSQRSKEFAHDYRYFPEPDLPPLSFDEKWINDVQAKLPELPQAKRQRFTLEYSLSAYDAGLLTESRETAAYFEELVRLGQGKYNAKEAANWLIGEASRLMNASNLDIDGFRVKVPVPAMAELIDFNIKGAINAATAKAVLGEIFTGGESAAAIIREKGLAQISDSSELEAMAAKIIADNPAAVADFRAGKEQALKFLIGQLMKASRGLANPALAGELLGQKIREV